MTFWPESDGRTGSPAQIIPSLYGTHFEYLATEWFPRMNRGR